MVAKRTLAIALNCSLDELTGLKDSKESTTLDSLYGLLATWNESKLKALAAVIK